MAKDVAEEENRRVLRVGAGWGKHNVAIDAGNDFRLAYGRALVKST